MQNDMHYTRPFATDFASSSPHGGRLAEPPIFLKDGTFGGGLCLDFLILIQSFCSYVGESNADLPFLDGKSIATHASLTLSLSIEDVVK